MRGNLIPPTRPDLLEPGVDLDRAAEPETPTAFRHFFERGIEPGMHEDNNPALGDVFERGASAPPAPALTFFRQLARYLFGPPAEQTDQDRPDHENL